MIDPNVFALAVIAVVGLIVVVAIFFGAWVRVKLPGGTVETMPNRRRKPSREQDTTFDGSAANVQDPPLQSGSSMKKRRKTRKKRKAAETNPPHS